MTNQPLTTGREGPHQPPATRDSATGWLVTITSLAKAVAATDKPWLNDVRRYTAPPPVWRMERAASLYQFEELLAAFEVAAGHRLLDGPLPEHLRNNLFPPSYRPPWSDRATVRPDDPGTDEARQS